jgi:hypothetical protein
MPPTLERKTLLLCPVLRPLPRQTASRIFAPDLGLIRTRATNRPKGHRRTTACLVHASLRPSGARDSLGLFSVGQR